MCVSDAGCVCVCVIDAGCVCSEVNAQLDMEMENRRLDALHRGR